jgi:hypothetical protein
MCTDIYQTSIACGHRIRIGVDRCHFQNECRWYAQREEPPITHLCWKCAKVEKAKQIEREKQVEKARQVEKAKQIEKLKQVQNVIQAGKATRDDEVRNTESSTFSALTSALLKQLEKEK